MSKQRDFESLLDSAEMRDFFFRAERELFPKMADSRVCLSIYSGGCDAKLAMELGAAILLDKPLLITAIKGATIPDKLRKCADAIVEIGGFQTSEDKQKVEAALRKLLSTDTGALPPQAEKQ